MFLVLGDPFLLAKVPATLAVEERLLAVLPLGVRGHLVVAHDLTKNQLIINKNRLALKISPPPQKKIFVKTQESLYILILNAEFPEI